MYNITKLNILWDKVKELEQSGGGSGLPDITTEEQKLGIKWVDGRDIYIRGFANVTPSYDVVNNGFNLAPYDIDNVIDVIGYAYVTDIDIEGNNGYVSLNYYQLNDAVYGNWLVFKNIDTSTIEYVFNRVSMLITYVKPGISNDAKTIKNTKTKKKNKEETK